MQSGGGTGPELGLGKGPVNPQPKNSPGRLRWLGALRIALWSGRFQSNVGRAAVVATSVLEWADMDVKGVGCDIGMEGMTAEVHGKIHLVDAKDGTGSFEVSLSGNGQTLTGHSSFTGKWVRATCPAE
jgi:hypothetical protein